MMQEPSPRRRRQKDAEIRPQAISRSTRDAQPLSFMDVMLSPLSTIDARSPTLKLESARKIGKAQAPPQEPWKILQKRFEAQSHDFEPDETQVWRIYERKRRAYSTFTPHTGWQRGFLRWTLTVLVGILTELVCVVTIACTTKLEETHIGLVEGVIVQGGYSYAFASFSLFVLLSLVFAAIAHCMCLIEPSCAGSGIPEVKAYLNGVEVPRMMDIRTLLTKMVGVIFAQASRLPLGKEGPMIHLGAIIGSRVSQAGLRFPGFSNSWRGLRNHKERRDLVACGTAAGVAAAFGSPIGGMLFAMEEGASYWSLNITWRAFVCAISTALLGFVMLSVLPSGFIAQSYYCGPFPSGRSMYSVHDIPYFCFMGICGGGVGACWNQLNRYLTMRRQRLIPWQLGEVLSITAIMALLSLTLPFAGTCKVLPDADPLMEVNALDYTSLLKSFQCDGPSSYNEMASLYLNSWDDVLRILFHLPLRNTTGAFVFSVQALLGFVVPYFILTFVTFGIAVPSGLFIPSLLSGAALGRLMGQVLHTRNRNLAHPGIYALIGASAMLGGITRMMVSLAVILLEVTGNLYLLVPLCLTLMLSRWIGNLFNDGIYESHMQLKEIPFLPAECPKEARVNHIRAGEVMARSLLCFRPIERAGCVYDTLSATWHHCYPLTIPEEENALKARQHIFGTISRHTLYVLLHLKALSTSSEVDLSAQQPQSPIVPYQDIEEFSSQSLDITHLVLSTQERTRWIDLRVYANTSPYMINQASSVVRAFRLFRTLGMRHLLVVDMRGRLVGMITRHELLEDHLEAASHHTPTLLSPSVWRPEQNEKPVLL